MLSLQVKPINNPGQTSKYYFTQDNYYFTGELTAKWQGISAERLQFEKNVTQDRLEATLAGMLPNGEIIGF